MGRVLLLVLLLVHCLGLVHPRPLAVWGAVLSGQLRAGRHLVEEEGCRHLVVEVVVLAMRTGRHGGGSLRREVVAAVPRLFVATVGRVRVAESRVERGLLVFVKVTCRWLSVGLLRRVEVMTG